MSDDHEQHGEHGGGGHGGGHGGGGHGGGHAEGEHEGAPEWLISFADNVALMMGFFVILLAMNMGPKGTPVQGGAPEDKDNFDAAAARGMDFVIGVRSAFNNPVDPGNPADAALVKRMREREAQGETKKPGPDGKKKDLSAVRPSDFVNVNALVTFPENASELSDHAEQALTQAAESLRGTQWVIELRGHVSALEAKRDKARAMKLAYDRSLIVGQYLAEQGVRWEQLRLVQCADNDRATPLASNTQQHADNQRVEVVVTQETVAPDPYSGH